jgi:CspA family cold shock protein
MILLHKNQYFKKLTYLAAITKNNIMNNGTVKFYDETKGFGFIKDANSTKEYFVHSSGLIDRINENDAVTFDLQEGKKGLNAVNVKLA